MVEKACTAECFAAGTLVVIGQDANGNYITEGIQDIKVGDTVLSRKAQKTGRGSIMAMATM